MTASGLYRGLWLRMAFTSLLGLVSLLFIVGIELATLWVFAWAFIDAGDEYAAGILLIVAFCTLVLLVWWVFVTLLKLVLTPGRISDRIPDPAVAPVMKDVGPALWNPFTVVPLKVLVVAWVLPLTVILSHVAITEWLGISTVVLGFLVAAVATATHTGKIIAEEFQSNSTVESELTDAYLVLDSAENDDIQRDITTRVHRLAAQADISPPAVRIGQSPFPQAATVGYRPEESVLVVSRGLIEELDDEELDAVLAHETAHLLNRDAAVLTALSIPPARASRVFSVAPLMVIAWTLAGFSRVAVSLVARYREYVADYAGARLTGDPAALASALAKLDHGARVSPSRDARAHRSTAAFGIVPPPWKERQFFDGVARFVRRTLLATHPPTEKRIRRLQSLESDRNR